MTNILEHWNGTITLNGETVDNNARLDINGPVHIVLRSNNGVDTEPQPIPRDTNNRTVISSDDLEYQITVKPYMTQPSSPEFDFMEKWNNNNPMPMRIMEGIKVKETKGMVYMDLHGLAEPTVTCYCCGKELTNPISRHYGIGPVCLSKLGISRDIDDVDGITAELVSIRWKGWIVKSAILEQHPIHS